MDHGSTDNATGIDPKFLDSWNLASNHYPGLTWEAPNFDNPPELDAYQDSNEGDAEVIDFIAAQGPPSRDSLEASVIDSTSDGRTVDFSSSTSFVGGTFSPRTHPSSGDDSSLPDNAWAHFRLSHPMGMTMPMNASYLDSYTKDATETNETVIVDDGGESGMRTAYTDFNPYAFSTMPQMTQSVTYGGPIWHNAVNRAPSIIPQFPMSPPLEPQSENDGRASMNGATVDQQWFPSVDMMPPHLNTSISHVPQSLTIHNGSQEVKPEPRNESRSPSVPENISGVFDTAYSGENSDTGFPDGQVKDEDLQIADWDESSPDANSPEMSPAAPKVSAFMVSQDFPDFPQTALEMNLQSAAAGPGGSRRTPLALQPASAARKRKQRHSATSIEQIHQPKPLQIVQEDGLGGAISSEDFVSPPRGARRKGPLSVVGRANAGLRRKNKDTCVQCRLNKRKCDGSSPCDACRPTLHEQPCARACFASIVEYGTCNYISQRAINHTTVNGSNRVRMEIPSAFDLNDLLLFLGERRGKFNIRASQSWGSLYVLDLVETHKFLKSLSEYNDNSQSTFLEFIDHRIIDSKDKSKNWLSCVKDCDPMNNIYTLLSRWNNMPSRATYSFVSVDGSTQDRLMDVGNDEDRKEILLAAQLSRIFCRMLEVEGFRKLERDFYNIKWKRISHDTHLRFLTELGNILLTLRWRVSWWRRLGDGGNEPDPTQQHYVDRVDLLCRILYVYYTNVHAKLPSWSAADVPQGTWSTYADAEHAVWDDLPLDATENGFQQWMDRGQDLIDQAGVFHRVSNHISKV